MLRNLPDDPYVGLVPYDEDHAQYFYGRSLEIKQVISNLTASRLTVLTGPSGAGKSSILMAGVLQEIRLIASQQVEPIHVGSGQQSVEPDEPPPTPHALVIRKWLGEPTLVILNEIKSIVPRLIAEKVDGFDQVSSPAELLEKSFSAGWNVDFYLILDQFEQFFLGRKGTEEAAFVSEIESIVSNPLIYANVLISIREDWLYRLDVFRPVLPKIYLNKLRVDHLTASAAREAIEGPVEEYNKHTPNQVKVEGNFVNAVLSDLQALRPRRSEIPSSVTATEGLPIIETPYLQLVMQTLWQEAMTKSEPALSIDQLAPRDPKEALPGARSREIVDEYVDRVTASLSELDKEHAARLLSVLAVHDSPKKPHGINELSSIAEVAYHDASRLLKSLSSDPSNRVLAEVPPPPGYPIEDLHYEVLHDVLVNRLARWSRSFLDEKKHAQARLEERRNLELRQKTRSNAALVALSTFLGFALLLAYIQYLDARASSIRADQKAREADYSAKTASFAANYAKRQESEAIHQETIAKENARRANQAQIEAKRSAKQAQNAARDALKARDQLKDVNLRLQAALGRERNLRESADRAQAWKQAIFDVAHAELELDESKVKEARVYRDQALNAFDRLRLQAISRYDQEFITNALDSLILAFTSKGLLQDALPIRISQERFDLLLFKPTDPKRLLKVVELAVLYVGSGNVREGEKLLNEVSPKIEAWSSSSKDVKHREGLVILRRSYVLLRATQKRWKEAVAEATTVVSLSRAMYGSVSQEVYDALVILYTTQAGANDARGSIRTLIEIAALDKAHPEFRKNSKTLPGD